MSDQPYTICIVVDPNFGEQLVLLPLGMPVWVVDTPINKPIAQRLWKERPSEKNLTGITTFDISVNNSPEENLIEELEMINLHHDIHSARPPYTHIEVFGTPLSDKIKLALADYGFDEFFPTSMGFLAIRKVPVSEAAS